MRRIYLIDCPGVVPVSANDSDTDTVLKGVVRVENLATPAEHIPSLLERVRVEYIERTYGLDHREGGWEGEVGAAILLSSIAKKSGKLLKGGEPDQEAAAKMVLNDWIRGKIPFFVPPPIKPPTEGELPVTEVTGETREVMEDQERALGQVLGEKRVKGVAQPLSKIVIMTKFLRDDARREEVVDETVADVDEEEVHLENEDEELVGESTDPIGGTSSGNFAEDGGLAWEDLFPSGPGPSRLSADNTLAGRAGSEGREPRGSEEFHARGLGDEDRDEQDEADMDDDEDDEDERDEKQASGAGASGEKTARGEFATSPPFTFSRCEQVKRRPTI